MKSVVSLKSLKTFNKRLVLDGIVVGMAGGFFSISYRYVLGYLNQLRERILDKPQGGIILLWGVLLLMAAYGVYRLLKFEPLSSGSGIPQVQGELLGAFHMNPKRILFSKFLGGSLAGFAGLSLGREGPSIQIGASIGKICSTLMHRNPTEKRYMISAGASAGLSAAFNAPISGVLFVLEEMHKSVFPIILIPTFIASVIADFLSKNIFGLAPAFAFSISMALPLSYYFHCLLLGVFVGAIGVIFNKTLLGFQAQYKKASVHPYIKIFAPFLAAGLLGYSFVFLLGGGHNLIENLISTDNTLGFLILLLVGKLIFTCFCYGSSVQGGIFLPVLVLGAISGSLYFKIFSLFGGMENTYLANFVILAMAGILTSVIRSPILSILLVTEMTGSFQHILSLCIVSIVAYLVAESLNCKPIYESLLNPMITKKIDGEDYKERTVFETRVNLDSPFLSKRLRDMGIPQNTLLLSIHRQEKEVLPRGDTIIQMGDVLTVMTDEGHLLEAKTFFRGEAV